MTCHDGETMIPDGLMRETAAGLFCPGNLAKKNGSDGEAKSACIQYVWFY